jgi:hypothetical protein
MRIAAARPVSRRYTSGSPCRIWRLNPKITEDGVCEFVQTPLSSATSLYP